MFLILFLFLYYHKCVLLIIVLDSLLDIQHISMTKVYGI